MQMLLSAKSIHLRGRKDKKGTDGPWSVRQTFFISTVSNGFKYFEAANSDLKKLEVIAF